MNAFKKKALASAVVAGFGFAGAANAVYLNQNGEGSALIYPYYTVQSQGDNAFNTYISVVNSTAVVKVVKVRFREGKNSREVLDFNLYLSPNDVWTGAVVPASAASTAPGRLITTDVSCTNPQIPATGVDFRNFEYSGARDDTLGTALSRTREGYIEMIEMGELDPTVAPGSAAVHAASGSPTCTGLRGTTVPAVAAAITVPTGGLSGTGTIINVNAGADTGYNAVALADLVPVSALPLYQDIGNDTPNFTNFDPVSAVISGQAAYRSDWAFGEDAVSSVFMHTDVVNEYVLDNATLSNTDWVLTFPTKSYYVNLGVAPISPFTAAFVKGQGACETIEFTYFNREERGAAAADADFSPLPPGGTPSALCHESTVLSIRNGEGHMPTGTDSGVLGSANSASVQIENAFQNGWANLQFTGANAVATGTGLPTDGNATSDTIDIGAGTVTAAVDHIYFGLPVTGFMVRTFNNGTLTCGTATCQGNYGASFGHKYRQLIQ